MSESWYNGLMLTTVAIAGTVSLTFMSAEIQETTGNGNWIKDSTGMSDTAYGWTYFGLNLASSIGAYF